MRSIVFVAGARPNFVKIAPMLRELATRTPEQACDLVHTGQHYDFEMSGVFFEQLGIRTPTARLDVGSGRHGAQTGRIMIALDEYLESVERPRGIVVVGDVNSTMAAALVAAKREIPIAHVEAGLRSFDRTMPEEINRVVTDAIADLLLVSEPTGLENLTREGVPSSRVRYTGNVMIDSLVDQLAAARALYVSASLGVTGEYAVVTLHRPSNVDDDRRLAELVRWLQRLAARIATVFPIHPRTAKRLEQLGLAETLRSTRQLHLVPPLGYREFLGLMDGARVVVSDSGGVQEETTFLGIPCVTLRATTERPITISQGTNTLVGDDLEAAWTAVLAALTKSDRQSCTIDGWDGRAAVRIADALLEVWR